MRHFTAIPNLTKTAFRHVMSLSRDIKANPGKYRTMLEGMTLIMYFEKPSTRTRLSFEVGMTQMGGHAIFFSGGHIDSKKEDVTDTAVIFSRFGDLILARTYRQETIEELAENSGVPVINGLSDERHPCQALADIFTIQEKKPNGRLTAAWVGDGSNVCRSVTLASAYAEIAMRIATPEGYEPGESVLGQARAMGGDVRLFRDPREAVADADVVLTDVWSGMGDEANREMKTRIFPPYQVNAELMSHAKNDSIFMHCLPANKGEEVTADVINGPQSVVYDEAENRLYTQKALMLYLLGMLEDEIC